MVGGIVQDDASGGARPRERRHLRQFEAPPRAIERRRWVRGLGPWQKLARMVRFGRVFWFMLSVGQNRMDVLNITLCKYRTEVK